MLQDLILRIDYVVQILLLNRFVPARYQLQKGKSAGLALEYFYMIHRVGRKLSGWRQVDLL